MIDDVTADVTADVLAPVGNLALQRLIRELEDALHARGINPTAHTRRLVRFVAQAAEEMDAERLGRVLP